MLDTLVITDSTTRDELIDHVNDLEEEVQKLETKIEDQQSEIESLALAPVQLNRLEDAADLMAAAGKILDTPYNKRQWIEGR